MLVDAIGWIGTVLVLAAYYLVSTSKLKPASGLYNWMNLSGAIIIGINVAYNHAWPAVGLNFVWGLIAINGLAKSYSARFRRTSKDKAGGSQSLEGLGGVLREPDSADG